MQQPLSFSGFSFPFPSSSLPSSFPSVSRTLDYTAVVLVSKLAPTNSFVPIPSGPPNAPIATRLASIYHFTGPHHFSAASVPLALRSKLTFFLPLRSSFHTYHAVEYQLLFVLSICMYHMAYVGVFSCFYVSRLFPSYTSTLCTLPSSFFFEAPSASFEVGSRVAFHNALWMHVIVVFADFADFLSGFSCSRFPSFLDYCSDTFFEEHIFG